MIGTEEILTLGATKLVDLYANGKLSPYEVMTAHLAHCESRNTDINAVFGIKHDYALDTAKQSEKRWQNKVPKGHLDGIPLLLKDSIKCKGFQYFHGSAVYDGTQADIDAPPAARVKEAHGIIFGKTTMPDFGMLAAGVSSAFGIIRNPWDLSKSPGGSSAGSGAAVAAGLAPLSIGTDIAGSVRLPCAQNGLVGLKPSRGRIPHLPPSPIRAAGPIARNVKDLGLLMSVIIRADHRDFEAVQPCDPEGYLSIHETPDTFIKDKRIGLMLEMGFGQKPDARVVKLISQQAHVFEDLGAKVELVPKITEKSPMEALYTLIKSRAFHELINRPKNLQPKLLRQISNWCSSIQEQSACDLSNALFELEDFKTDVVAKLNPYDYIISPALTVISFPAEQTAPIEDDHFAHCCYQIPFNQTGAPALSINAGFIDGMPVGMQLAGRRYDDLGALKIAWLYEQNRVENINWPIFK